MVVLVCRDSIFEAEFMFLFKFVGKVNVKCGEKCTFAAEKRLNTQKKQWQAIL